MEQLTLAGRPTTSLGFGGSLLGSTTPAVSLQLLNTAYDEGIRHFDVAPLYGFGRSESMLREAFGKRLQDVTITTKYGLAAPAHSSWIGPLHRLAKAVLSPLPGMKRVLQKTRGAEEAEPPLTAAAAGQSIDNSLRQLGVETIDLLLLHEATPDRLRDQDLLGLLEDYRHRGKIRQFGVGSRSERVCACLRERPDFCPIVQFEWNVFSAMDPELATLPRIVHGSLTGPRAAFTTWLLEDAQRCARWSLLAGVDLREPGIINRLLFKASLENHAGHIVLFSTRTVANIKSNVQTASDKSLAAPARVLKNLVHAEYPAVETTATTAKTGRGEMGTQPPSWSDARRLGDINPPSPSQRL